MANNPNGRDGAWRSRDREHERARARGAARNEPTEHYGGGQSGYGAGRLGDDRAMGPGFRNQAQWSERYEDRQGIRTDDRFTGRGGPDWPVDEPPDQPRDYPEWTSAPHGPGRGLEDEWGVADRGYQSGYGHDTGFGGRGAPGLPRHVGFHARFRGAPYRATPTPYRIGPYGGRYPDLGPSWPPPYVYEELEGGHRGKGPRGYTRSDDRIREHVCEALAEDDFIDATHIEVVVQNGEVMLTGTVGDRRIKRMVEDLVEHQPGVKDVQNQLRVAGVHPRVARGNPEGGSEVGWTEPEGSSDRRHRA